VTRKSGAGDSDGEKIPLGLSFLGFDAFEIADLVVTPLGINAGNVGVQIVLVGPEVVGELGGCFVGSPSTVLGYPLLESWYNTFPEGALDMFLNPFVLIGVERGPVDRNSPV